MSEQRTVMEFEIRIFKQSLLSKSWISSAKKTSEQSSVKEFAQSSFRRGQWVNLS